MSRAPSPAAPSGHDLALPAILPSVARAKLPKTYEQAREAIQACSRIDECKDWADKAQAMASYAKQAGDKTLEHAAQRIQARAIQRCGELLRAMKRPDRGGRPARNGGGRGPRF